MKKWSNGVYLIEGHRVVPSEMVEHSEEMKRFHPSDREKAKKNTIAYDILAKHNTSGSMSQLQLKFDALVGQDMTYMGVLETAIASGVEKFPIPFVLSNCHNALCYSNGTSNEDDHLYALGAAKKYGAIFLPTHAAVMHQYMRECFAGGGKMILGADSHTRYGALGTLATGEGGGELVKQLLGRTYDIDYPTTVLVFLHGRPVPGVGPQDVALALIGEVFKDGFVKNCIIEFCGPGVNNLSVDFRNGIDVMTTESSAMFSIWETDDKVKDWLTLHKRPNDHVVLHPGELAYYDRCIEIDLDDIRPMIALPFHPSNAISIEKLNENLTEILHQTEVACNKQMEEFNLKIDLLSKVKDDSLYVDQGVIAGCAGGLFENISKSADILKGKNIGNNGFSLNYYPASQPVLHQVIENKIGLSILEAGANLRSAFCGPCFGAGDVPFNGGFSIRHTTRNFSNRDGSQPGKGQMTSVALMDALSIAATAVNGGRLTPATEYLGNYTTYNYQFNKSLYIDRVLDCFGKADPKEEIIKGPGIGDIPDIPELNENLLLKCTAFITDPVTTTDELIPNGESSSYRSNFEKIADFTLSAKVPEYVRRCKEVREEQRSLQKKQSLDSLTPEVNEVLSILHEKGINIEAGNLCIGSLLYARRPGDGSAREYAASNQKVLGGWANLCLQYATKRYRSNLINWGVLPFTVQEEPNFNVGSYLFIPNIKTKLLEGESNIKGFVIENNAVKQIRMSLGELTQKERTIIADGCLINYYKKGN